ncbi:hypothetical protein, partial [Haematobacter genomosp. 1]
PAEAVPAAPEEPKATPVANTTPAEREAETTPVLSPEKQGEEHHPSSQTPESNAGMETAKPVNDPNRPTTSLPEAVDEESVLSRLHAIEKRQGSLLGDLTAWRDKANSLAQANRNRESTSDMRAGEVQNAPEVRPVEQDTPAASIIGKSNASDLRKRLNVLGAENSKRTEPKI